MKTFFTPLFPLALAFLAGCSDVEDDHDHDHDHDHEHEVITTVELTFTPTNGGEDLVFTWADPEDDGNPVIDDIVLQSATTDYQLSIAFLNELEEPFEDVTEEIAMEADEHQVFLTGTGVEGPATGTNDDALISHLYADSDDDGLPVGLLNDIRTLKTGTGELELALRHLPYENNAPVKTEGMAEDVASGGLGAIAGANDVSVTFNIEVE